MSPAALIAALVACVLVACGGAHHSVMNVVAMFGAGQSNEIGRDAAPAGTSIPGYYQKVTWEDNQVSAPALRLPIRPFSGFYGFQHSVAKRLISRGRTVAVLKHASGGTSITEWLEGTALGDGLVANIQQFLTELGSAYPGSNLIPVLQWGHGETDAINLGTANAYQGHFQALVNRLRARFPTIRIFAHGIHAGITGCPHSAVVNAAMAALLGSDYIAPSWTATFIDTFHFTVLGIENGGAVIGDAIHAAI